MDLSPALRTETSAVLNLAGILPASQDSGVLRAMTSQPCDCDWRFDWEDVWVEQLHNSRASKSHQKEKVESGRQWRLRPARPGRGLAARGGGGLPDGSERGARSRHGGRPLPGPRCFWEQLQHGKRAGPGREEGPGRLASRGKVPRRRSGEAQAFLLLGACRGVAPSPSRGGSRLPASCSRPARSGSVQYRSRPGDVRALCGRQHGPHSCSQRGGGPLCRLRNQTGAASSAASLAWAAAPASPPRLLRARLPGRALLQP